MSDEVIASGAPTAIAATEGNTIGASSEHLILDVSGLGLEVGSEVEFDVGYGALLRAMTSPYVEKIHLP